MSQLDSNQWHWRLVTILSGIKKAFLFNSKCVSVRLGIIPAIVSKLVPSKPHHQVRQWQLHYTRSWAHKGNPVHWNHNRALMIQMMKEASSPKGSAANVGILGRSPKFCATSLYGTTSWKGILKKRLPKVMCKSNQQVSLSARSYWIDQLLRWCYIMVIQMIMMKNSHFKYTFYFPVPHDE